MYQHVGLFSDTSCQATSDAGWTAQVSGTSSKGQSCRLQASERQPGGRRAALQPWVECEGCDGDGWPVTHQHHSICCGEKKCTVMLSATCICYLQINEHYAITRVLHLGPLLNKCGGPQLADICHSMGMTSCQYFSFSCPSRVFRLVTQSSWCCCITRTESWCICLWWAVDWLSLSEADWRWSHKTTVHVRF